MVRERCDFPGDPRFNARTVVSTGNLKMSDRASLLFGVNPVSLSYQTNSYQISNTELTFLGPIVGHLWSIFSNRHLEEHLFGI